VHNLHSEEAFVELNVPASHAVQVAEPIVSLYVPAMQDLQLGISPLIAVD
jgi:hypothetical protein